MASHSKSKPGMAISGKAVARTKVSKATFNLGPVPKTLRETLRKPTKPTPADIRPRQVAPKSRRHAFWSADFKRCYECASKDRMTNVKEVSAVRHNGDAVGTETFTCKDCGWKMTMDFDDAGEPYYCETELWKDSLENYPVLWMDLWMKLNDLDTQVCDVIKTQELDGRKLWAILDNQAEAENLFGENLTAVKKAVYNFEKI